MLRRTLLHALRASLQLTRTDVGLKYEGPAKCRAFVLWWADYKMTLWAPSEAREV